LGENAIKHNVVSSRQPLTISVATTANDTICVSNPIQPKRELEKGEGIGLVNLSERYRLMWQRDIVINQDNGTFSGEIGLFNGQ
jgi:LytS/YehU family sensor histidine kinase